MKIQTQYLTTNNSYDQNNPCAIVVHNTDNFKASADAKAHAEGLKDGYMQGMSWHVVTDDKAAYQCLPYNRGAWHVGVNYGGKLFGKINNRNSVCVEMCVNAGCDYEKAFLNTVDVVKQLMKELNIPAEMVYQHYDICAKNCPSQIRAKGDWDRFKKLIGASGTDYAPATEVHVDQYYRVRTSWENSASQLGAYEKLQNALDHCPAGYSVFDWNGKAIHTSVAKGRQARMMNGLSETEKIMFMAPMYQEVARKTGLLASVGLAQFCLESGYGTTDLAQNANNMHGMKCSLSGNTWAGSTWDGVSKYNKKTAEQDKNGNTYYINADFRKYPCMEDSVADRAAYYLGAMNGSSRRYPGIENLKTADAQIRAIKAGGYATDVNYVSKLMNIVNRFNLTQYDVPVDPKPQPTPHPEPTPEPSVIYRVQVGAYEKRGRASDCASTTQKRSGYKCFMEKAADGLYHVYCGSFEDKTNAWQRKDALEKLAIQAIIKEVAK